MFILHKSPDFSDTMGFHNLLLSEVGTAGSRVDIYKIVELAEIAGCQTNRTTEYSLD